MIIPKLPRRADLIAIAYGLLLFAWLSLEDHSALPPAVLGAGAAVLIGLRWILIHMGGATIHMRSALLIAVLWGAAIGAGAALAAALLMFFKTAWHAHPFPDYPLPMIVEMLTRSPAWAAAGGFAALAGVMFRSAAT